MFLVVFEWICNGYVDNLYNLPAAFAAFSESSFTAVWNLPFESNVIPR